MIFDTHAHYDDEAFDRDRDELLRGMREHGVEAVVNIGASIQSTKDTLKLIKTYPNVYGVVGVHPSECAELDDTHLSWLESISTKEKVLAIGEIGLDYYWDTPAREVQKKWFIAQLNVAKKVKLPIVIHSRDAANDTLQIMKQESAKDLGGVIHCFSYGTEMAREFLNMGFYLGIGGVVTFSNAKNIKEVVAYTPMDRIVLETDCPYLSPVPFRGKRNSSLNLPYVVEAISEIKGITKEEVIKITNNNAKVMYGLSIQQGE